MHEVLFRFVESFKAYNEKDLADALKSVFLVKVLLKSNGSRNLFFFINKRRLQTQKKTFQNYDEYLRWFSKQNKTKTYQLQMEIDAPTKQSHFITVSLLFLIRKRKFCYVIHTSRKIDPYNEERTRKNYTKSNKRQLERENDFLRKTEQGSPQCRQCYQACRGWKNCWNNNDTT